MAMILRSSAFTDGQPIPKRYTGEGEDVSPPLEWTHAPKATKEFVLICDDPDAPTPEPWVHWLLYGLSGTTQSLPEKLATAPHVKSPVDVLQGRNSWDQGITTGYRGPMPPRGHGVHHYHFRLFALNEASHLPPAAQRNDVWQAIAGKIADEAVLIGTYER